MDLKRNRMGGSGCIPLASEGQVAGSCDHENEYSTQKLANFLIS
jgi:hypothetical protein